MYYSIYDEWGNFQRCYTTYKQAFAYLYAYGGAGWRIEEEY